MKLTCPQDNLSKGLATVNRAVSTRSTMPILSNILLATDGPRLKLSATNLELSINCWIEAEIEQEGRVAVPARLLQEFVNSLPSAPVKMELNPSNRVVKMHCLRTDGNIRGVSAEEFPAIPTVEDGAVFRQPAHLLKEMISQVAIAAATDDSGGNFIVVTLLAALMAPLPKQAETSTETVDGYLRQLAGAPAEALEAAEVVWVPDRGEEPLTNDELLAQFPNLSDI